jgi:hypothetical protein
MERVKRVAIIVVAALGVGYLGLCGLLFFTQRSMLFPAPKEPLQPASMKVVRLEGGGLFLYRAPPTPDAPVLVHFHGNAEQAGHDAFLATSFPVGLAVVEYPGYGLLASEGEPSEEALVDVAVRAVAHLTGPMGIARERIVLSGQSVGTGVAVELAHRKLGAKLLLLTPYTSLPDVAAQMLPMFPVRLLMRDRFDSLSKAPGIHLPVLVIHGTKDEVIPFELGRTLGAAFPRGQFVAVTGGHHNDLWDRPEVIAHVGEFLQ